MDTAKITSLLARFMELGISEQLDYEKFNLYSIITNSTAIEGSTITEVENHLMFEDGLAPAGRTIVEQMMNLDLKEAYEQAMHNAHTHREITKDSLCELSALVLKNTGSKHSTMQGEFDSSKGELRLVNVSAGAAGRSYMDFKKVPQRLAEFCEWLNTERKNLKTSDIFGAYRLSFIAHYRLVTIHPWANGNGRMARLLMHQLQWEKNLLPTIVYRDRKPEYINSLLQTRENKDENIFCEFMLGELARFLEHCIQGYESSAMHNA